MTKAKNYHTKNPGNRGKDSESTERYNNKFKSITEAKGGKKFFGAVRQN